MPLLMSTLFLLVERLAGGFLLTFGRRPGAIFYKREGENDHYDIYKNYARKDNHVTTNGMSLEINTAIIRKHDVYFKESAGPLPRVPPSSSVVLPPGHY
ncbi:hypothetical protein Tco_0248930 [Tanacetum coccineum]